MPDKMKLDPAASKTFCVLPWIHSYIATDGQAGLCSISTEPLIGPNGGLHVQRDSLLDLFHSPAMDETRRRLLEGKPLKGCTACYDAERLGGSSQRTQYDHYWKERVPGLMDRIRDRQEKAAFEKPLSVDIRFGNLCNLRCLPCNPHNSTEIERDSVLSKWSHAHYMRMDGRLQGEWYDAPELESEIADFSSNIQFIHLAGGEPSISKPAHKWLTGLVAGGQAAGIELRVLTNLTNVNSKFLDLVMQFGRPMVFASIDGFGPLNDYLRYPSQWRIIDRNAHYLRELAKRSNLKVYVTPAVSAYNALSIVHLFEWAAGLGFDVIASHVRGVDQIDCALLPAEARARAVQRMRDFLEAAEKPAPYHHSTIDALCRYLELPVDPAYSAACLEKFHAFTHEVDRDRGMRFEDYAPEMARFLGYSSGSNYVTRSASAP
jgi:radical SAM family protein